MKRNIKYKSEELFNYYKKNRVVWSQLYKSERKLLNKLQLKNKEILDVGCACGGLGDILKKKFNIKTYTGIEIHKKQYNYAKNNIPSIHINHCIRIIFLSKGSANQMGIAIKINNT